jgi:uncharacterized protein YndB with AHSA1/START domain
MGHEFEIRERAEVAATPEQVWAAIATGPGIDSWFMGHNEVEPGAGGAVRTAFGGYRPESTVTAWEPGERFAHRSGDDASGRFIAYEFLIEGRGGGSTVLRTVTNGFLPGDDWADEYEAMTLGLALFFRTLVEYLTHFVGRTATPVTAFGPPVEDWERTWALLGKAFGLAARTREGDRVRVAVPGLAPIDGVVYFVNPHTVAVRAGDGLYRFLRGFRGPLIASHHIFTGPGEDQQAWQSWLTELFTDSTDDEGTRQ